MKVSLAPVAQTHVHVSFTATISAATCAAFMAANATTDRSIKGTIEVVREDVGDQLFGYLLGRISPRPGVSTSISVDCEIGYPFAEGAIAAAVVDRLNEEMVAEDRARMLAADIPRAMLAAAPRYRAVLEARSGVAALLADSGVNPAGNPDADDPDLEARLRTIEPLVLMAFNDGEAVANEWNAITAEIMAPWLITGIVELNSSYPIGHPWTEAVQRVAICYGSPSLRTAGERLARDAVRAVESPIDVLFKAYPNDRALFASASLLFGPDRRQLVMCRNKLAEALQAREVAKARAAWIDKHGSAAIHEAMAAGYNVTRRYREERVAQVVSQINAAVAKYNRTDPFLITSSALVTAVVDWKNDGPTEAKASPSLAMVRFEIAIERLLPSCETEIVYLVDEDHRFGPTDEALRVIDLFAGCPNVYLSLPSHAELDPPDDLAPL
jgi:hypothetical protein